MKRVATAKDSEYGYIETFVDIFAKLADVIANLFDRFVTTLGNLSSLVKKDDEEEA